MMDRAAAERDLLDWMQRPVWGDDEERFEALAAKLRAPEDVPSGN